MENFVSAAGMIVILGVAALVLRTAIGMIFGKQRNQALLGVQFAILFGLIYGFHEALLEFAGLGNFTSDIGKAVAALIWFSIAFFLTGSLNRYVWHGILAVNGQPSVPRLLTDFAQIFIYLAAIMVVMHFVYAQSITALAATSGAFAFIIGYSAQSTLAELFAGISLNLARSIKKGDIVRIDDTFGRVADINWRCVSIMEPRSGSTVVLPNNKVAGSKITNYSLPEPLYRRAAYFTVEFSAPPDLVIRATTEHLRRAPAILNDPAPLVHVREYTALGIEYRALWYLRRDSDWWRAWNECHEAIWTALRQHGIQPGLNHRDAGQGGRFDEDAWSVRVREDSAEIRRRLAAVSMFNDLGEQALDDAVKAVQRHDCGTTDFIYERGDDGGPLFVVAEGRVALMQSDETGQAYAAAELGPGAVFGVTAAAEPGVQRATAQAIQMSVVYEISAEWAHAQLDSNPKFAATVATALEDRNREFGFGHAAHLREIAREAGMAEKQKLMKELSHQIKDFFSGGFKAGFRTLFSTGRDDQQTKKLLEAIMAGAALVAVADGEVEAEERGHVVQTLKSLNLLDQIETNADAALAMFDDFCTKIAADPKDGVAAALEHVGKISGDPERAEIVVGICTAISAADGELEPAEEARLSEIRHILNAGGNGDVEG